MKYTVMEQTQQQSIPRLDEMSITITTTYREKGTDCARARAREREGGGKQQKHEDKIPPDSKQRAFRIFGESPSSAPAPASFASQPSPFSPRKCDATPPRGVGHDGRRGESKQEKGSPFRAAAGYTAATTVGQTAIDHIRRQATHLAGLSECVSAQTSTSISLGTAGKCHSGDSNMHPGMEWNGMECNVM